MANLADILSYRYKGNEWSLTDDDYSTLVWHAVNVTPKPTEAELRALSAAVDVDKADDARRERQNDAILDRRDALLTALEILVVSIDDMQTKLRAASLLSPLAPAAVTAIGTLRTKLTQARNLP